MTDKNNDKKIFIKESVAKKNRYKTALKRIAILIISGIIFGIAFICTIIIAKPLLKNIIYLKESGEYQQISIPKDDDSIEIVVDKDSGIFETEPVEEIVQSAIENYKYSSENISSMYSHLSNMISNLEDAIVAVRSVKNDKDWFDNKVENSGTYAGVIIAYTDTEVIILTSSLAVSDVDNIIIRFNSGEEADGILKREDKISGLAIVSVDISSLGQGTYTKLKTFELGNSYQVKKGDFIAMVGSPMGMLRSVTYGNIGYVARNVSAIDGSVRLIYADAKSDYKAGSFMINTDGELIGIVSNNYNKDFDLVPVVGISDLKSLLENMSNNKATAYLGITAVEMIHDDEETLNGLFIKAVEKDSPAYLAGLQPGDIISQIDGKETNTLADLKNILEELQVNDNIKILINRNGRDIYQKIEFNILVGER